MFARSGGRVPSRVSIEHHAEGNREMSVVLYAEFTAKEGSEARVCELLRDLGSRVRNEPGNVTFASHTLVEQPRRFFVYEVYADADAFDAHLRAPHGGVFNAALSDLIEEEHSILTFLNPLD